MKVAIYARVSTKEQNLELQLSELAAFAKARGWDFEVFEEKASGTSIAKRPEFQRLMNLARSRKFQGILVWKLDRFGRSTKDLVATLQELYELKIDFISLRDSIDMSTASGKLLMHIVSAFAEFEANMIRERVSAGIAHRKAKGLPIGKKRIHDPKTIRELRDSGLSYRAIAKKTGAPMGVVSRALATKKEA